MTNRFRFVQSMGKGMHAVIEGSTGIRYPGFVVVENRGTPDAMLVWRRELPQKGKRPAVIASLRDKTVAGLSAKLDAFFGEVNDG